MASRWSLGQKRPDFVARRRAHRAVESAIDQTAEELRQFLGQELERPEHRVLVVAECERARKSLLDEQAAALSPETLNACRAHLNHLLAQRERLPRPSPVEEPPTADEEP